MFTIGKWHFSPFKKRLIKRSRLGKMTGTEDKKAMWWDSLVPIANIAWAIIFGWWMVALQAVVAVSACAGIVTIPLGIAQFRYLGTLFAPFGVAIISEDEYKELKLQNSEVLRKAKENT